MSKMAQSGFVMTSLGLLVGLQFFNSCQLDNLEAQVITNQKKIDALARNGGNTRGGGATSAPVGTGEDRYTASKEELAALADPANLLKPRARPMVNAATVVPGQTLRTKIGQDPRGMNPYIASGADVTEYNRFISNYLGGRQLDNPDEFYPELALKVTTPDDGLTYIIELRKGVYWHEPTVDWSSGRYDWLRGEHEVVADDFIFVFDMIKNPQVAGRVSSLRTYFDPLESYEAIDDYTIKVKYAERLYTNLPILLELPPMPRWLYMHDEDGREFDDATWGLKLNEHWYNRKGIGTGPYKFLSWEPGVKIELVANPDYWGEPAAFERVLMPVIKDQNAWPRKLKTGELDITQLQPEQYRTEVRDNKTGVYLGNEHLVSTTHDTLGYFYLGWNMDKPLFSDKRVRKALTMALNRQGIVDNVFHGLGVVTSGPFAQQTPCYDPSIAPHPFDLEAAGALLDEAGWVDSDGDGIRDKMVEGEKLDFRFNFLIYGSSTEWETLANVYREDLLSIGIQLTPVAVEWSTMLKKMDEHEFDVYSGAWVLGWDTDLMQLWHSSEADRPKSSNRVGFRNPDADRIAEELRRTLDFDKRQELCHDFHALLHEEQPYTFVYQRRRPILYWDHLNDPDFSQVYPYRDLRYFSFSTAARP